MDERLAQIYGTGQTDAGEDLQKTAAAELLVKLAAQEGIDLDKCSDAQIEAMVTELFKTAEFPPPAADKKETKGEESSGVESKDESKDEKKDESKESKEAAATDQEKEAQAKFAEADFLGRTMAHAMVQELDRIEKNAGKMGNLANLVKGKASEAAKKAGGAVASAAKKPGIAAGAAGAGGAAAGFLAGRAGKKKESSAEQSALTTLVQQRAYDLLKTAGYVEEDGSVKAPPAAEVPAAETQEKQASALDLVVTEQALKLLAAEGYPVNWGNKE